MTYALICAGGRGLRFGGDVPKQFIETNGKPILLQTVEVFERTAEIEKIVVMCPKGYLKEAEEILSLCKKAYVTEGGADRNLSVMNGIAYIEEHFGLDEKTIVVTHDAVRPFVSEKMIVRSIEEAKKYGAAVAAVPAVDTVIEVENGVITSVPDRQKMYQVQTPQTFYAKKLRELYLSLSQEEKNILTDCSRIYVSKGETVRVVDGDIKNIKITFKSDIE
ncbi:MAG: IspD/TarI family cytidylyltransferase [Acutalibacteraceae bacterium]